ncbi:MAG TPA: MOSC domain-containing protein, partial [Candidatus Lustribacter sp.]|nr:MOSC domain-containing protein [Candidatus Lustribacter sp.]
LDLRGARTGDRWRIGAPADPAHVVVEVTTPRIPCATFARWLGEPSWVKRFAAYGESGCYLRVLRAGRLSAGAPIEVLVRGTGPTMGEQLATEMNLGA